MPNDDTQFNNGTSLGSGESDKYTLKQPGADNLSGAITRKTTNYNVDVIWTDESGTELETESIASAVSGGTQTTFDKPARSPYCKLKISDDGSGSGTYDLVANLR